MIILAENNAFQNIDKCIQGKCHYDNNKLSPCHEIEDMLQFCIQIIFHDRINIAGNVPDKIVDKSQGIIDELLKDGIDVFHIEPFGGETRMEVKAREEALISAALEVIESDIDDYLKICSANYQKTDIKTLLAYLPVLDRGLLALVSEATDAIKNGRMNYFVAVGNQADVTKDGGLVSVFCAPQVIEKIINEAAKESVNWNESMTLYLVVKFRNVLNHTLAKQDGQTLSQSVIRARTILEEQRSTYGRIYDKIEDIFRNVNQLTMGQVIKDHTPEFAEIRNVIIPSLTQYLINKSNGDVLKILGETVVLRDKFSCLRDYIRHRKEEDIYQRWLLGLNEIAQDVAKTITGLHNYPPQTVTANILTPPTPIGQLSIPLSSMQYLKFWELPQRMKREASVQAFTEVTCNEPINANSFSAAERKLINNCTKNYNKLE